MVLKKIFGKKDSKAGIDSLKERFSQVSQTPSSQVVSSSPSVSSPQVPPSQSVPPQSNVQEISGAPNQVQVHDALGNPVVSDTPSSVPPAQSQVPSMQASPQSQSVPPAQAASPQPFGQQPLGFAPSMQASPQSQPAPAQPAPVSSPSSQPPQQGIDFSSIPPAQPAPVSSSSTQQASPQSQPAPAQSVPPAQAASPQPTPGPSNPITDLPSWAVESAGEEIANEIGDTTSSEPQNQNKAADTLEQIEDKFYDAKLNSLIIDQVKELIEIDNNLNSRIDDLSSEMKKEITEREKLGKKVDEHFDKVKELETNMEKFLGLYEMVTNQFNPFVDKGSSEMFLDEKDKKYDNPMIRDPEHPNIPIPQEEDAPNPIPAELRVDSTPTSASPSPVPQQVQQSIPPSMGASSPVPAPSMSTDQGAWKYCPIHHNIHPSLHFELVNGQKLSSIYDVLAVVEQMDDETFSHHVNLKQNDLSNWIYKVLGLTDLGQQLDLIKTRPEMVRSIRSYIQDKMKSANQHHS